MNHPYNMGNTNTVQDLETVIVDTRHKDTRREGCSYSTDSYNAVVDQVNRMEASLNLFRPVGQYDTLLRDVVSDTVTVKKDLTASCMASTMW